MSYIMPIFKVLILSTLEILTFKGSKVGSTLLTKGYVMVIQVSLFPVSFNAGIIRNFQTPIPLQTASGTYGM